MDEGELKMNRGSPPKANDVSNKEIVQHAKMINDDDKDDVMLL